VDVVDECPEETEEPEAPGSTCRSLPLVGHEHIDVGQAPRELGPKVGESERPVPKEFICRHQTLRPHLPRHEQVISTQGLSA